MITQTEGWAPRASRRPLPSGTGASQAAHGEAVLVALKHHQAHPRLEDTNLQGLICWVLREEGCREELPDSGSSICRVRMGQCKPPPRRHPASPGVAPLPAPLPHSGARLPPHT